MGLRRTPLKISGGSVDVLYRRQAIRAIGVVIDRCHGVGARVQENLVCFSIRIGSVMAAIRQNTSPPPLHAAQIPYPARLTRAERFSRCELADSWENDDVPAQFSRSSAGLSPAKTTDRIHPDPASSLVA
jgi:hypothetical protein